MSAPQKRPLLGRCDALSLHLTRQVQKGRQLLEVQEEMMVRAGGKDHHFFHLRHLVDS